MTGVQTCALPISLNASYQLYYSIILVPIQRNSRVRQNWPGCSDGAVEYMDPEAEYHMISIPAESCNRIRNGFRMSNFKFREHPSVRVQAMEKAASITGGGTAATLLTGHMT